MVLHQGRIERFFLDSLAEYSDIQVERGVLPEQLDIDHSKAEDLDAYPIRVRVRHLDDDEATPFQQSTNVPDGLFRSSLAKDDTDDLIRRSQGKNGTTEVIRTKYMIGCDGAHSWTRRQLGFSMEGEQTDFIWGKGKSALPEAIRDLIVSRCARHHSNYRFPRYPYALCNPQRRMWQRNGHSSREEARSTLHPTHRGFQKRRPSRPLNNHPIHNPTSRSKDHVSLQTNLHLLRLVDRLPNRPTRRQQILLLRPRLPRRRRSPHPLPQSGPRHERLHARLLQPRLENRPRPQRHRSPLHPQNLPIRTPPRRSRSHRIRPPLLTPLFRPPSKGRRRRSRHLHG